MLPACSVAPKVARGFPLPVGDTYALKRGVQALSGCGHSVLQVPCLGPCASPLSFLPWLSFCAVTRLLCPAETSSVCLLWPNCAWGAPVCSAACTGFPRGSPALPAELSSSPLDCILFLGKAPLCVSGTQESSPAGVARNVCPSGMF